MKGISASIVIPCFNEEITIAETIREFVSVLRGEYPSIEVIVVDNGSTDSTFDMASQAIAELSVSGRVVSEPRKGKGFALRKGFAATNGDVIVMTDGDLTYSADNVLLMVRMVEDGSADMVVGDRLSSGVYASQNERNGHNIGNTVFAWCASRLYKTRLNDVFSGLRVVSRDFIASFPLMSTGFQVEIELTMHALDKRLLVAEVPVEYRARPTGSSSKLSTFKDGFRILGALFGSLKLYRPMLIFGSISLVLSISGLISGLFPVVEYFETGFISRLPLAILAVGLELSAGISLSVALVLDSVSRLSKQEFEILYFRLRTDSNLYREARS